MCKFRFNFFRKPFENLFSGNSTKTEDLEKKHILFFAKSVLDIYLIVSEKFHLASEIIGFFLEASA